MKKHKISGPAMFMYSVIAVTVMTASACFGTYYSGRTQSGAVLWTGIVACMIVYHFWGRIIMGNVTKLFSINRNHWWFRERFFEEKLYRILRVKRWKGKALTYNPELFSLKSRSLDEIADSMTKAETDHWVNEVISLVSVLFSLLWGKFWLFLAVAVFAMIFDGQFIVIQRYNRPRLLRILEKEKLRAGT